MSRKRGKLSTEEETFIRDHANSLSLQEISIRLNRTEDTIKDFCIRNRLTYSGMTEERYDDTILLQKLVSRPYWAEVRTQFTADELQYFAVTWIRIMKQFREDILYTEELQVKQWITLEITSNRVMRQRKVAVEQIDRLQAELDQQYLLPVEERNHERITGLEMELGLQRNSLSSFTVEHSKVLDRIKDIQRDLKAARADRVKKIEDSKSSWTGILKALEEEEIRDRLGTDVAIMHLAKKQAESDFARYHTYEDNQVDQPLLTPETAKDE